jgi:protein required for attachment to host cells
MQLAHNSFVVVADGRKMLLLRNEGDAVHPNLEVVDVDIQDNPADRDQSSDRPGRSFQSSGPGHRSAFEETDFHQLEEDRFAAATADILKRRALRGDFEKLVVVAPPPTLGELRKHYHKSVLERISGELAKDLTGHPIKSIETIIVAA